MSDISRRSLINLVGRAGSAAAFYNTLSAMGLLSAPTAHARSPDLPAASGRGIRVVILGAGIAGMTAGYRLRKAGYECVILEARGRPGGRVWTIRGGDRIDETDSTQHVTWDRDPHLYFNAGPARLSHHHAGILSYCREFGIPLEIFVNDNRAAFLQNDMAFDGRPQSIGRVTADLRGAIASLAAAALAAKGTAPSDPRFRLVQGFGDLQENMTYAGSTRGGYATAPGAGDQSGEPHRQPLSLEDMVNHAKDDVLKFGFGMFFPETWDQSATMLQPVGGMDAIARAFGRALGTTINYHAQVVRIGRVGQRARVTWRDPRTGRETATDADFVICTIPLPVLKSIPADFSDAVKRAIETGARVYIPAVKVGFQSSRRWWETDHQLYGGISWTARDITQIWYPSHGFHRKNGILVGAYIWTNAIGQRFTAMTPAERHAAAIKDAEAIHPGYASVVDRGASVAWSKIPFTLGAWAEWDDFDGSRKEAYPVLLAGDGPFYFAGEHMSHVNGWQEGAVQSAHYTVGRIAEQVRTHRT